jgi:hypothetical protein
VDVIIRKAVFSCPPKDSLKVFRAWGERVVNESLPSDIGNGFQFIAAVNSDANHLPDVVTTRDPLVPVHLLKGLGRASVNYAPDGASLIRDDVRLPRAVRTPLVEGDPVAVKASSPLLSDMTGAPLLPVPRKVTAVSEVPLIAHSRLLLSLLGLSYYN